MKPRLVRVITVLLLLCLVASCSNRSVDSDALVKETLGSDESRGPTPTPVPVFPEFEYEVSEPEVGEADGRTRPVTFYRDGNPIEGKITVPEGDGPFKTIIISSGLYAHLGRYSGKALRYSDYGYAVIEFHFQNGDPPPGYADPEYLGDFICEQVLDLYAIIDSTEYFPELDRSNIYLYGHSMGGLVSAYAGTLRQTEIRGLLLVDPSFYAADIMNFENEQTITTDIYPLISRCYIPVVIITGTEGSFGEDPHFFDDAREALPDCEYVVIEGADHHMDGEAGDKVVDSSVEVMAAWDARE